MLVSNPACENKQMSTLDVPLDGRANRTGLPVSAHELFAVENKPIAATFRSSGFPADETPAVVGSTATMSFAVAPGVAALNEIASSPALGTGTIRETAFELEPSGFRTCMLTLPLTATSPAVIAAVHSVVEMH